jgi:hypothetical protein
VTLDDAIDWARDLDDSATADELSAGIQKIGALVPDLDIGFQESNEIGGSLVTLNADVLGDRATPAPRSMTSTPLGMTWKHRSRRARTANPPGAGAKISGASRVSAGKIPTLSRHEHALSRCNRRALATE